MNSAKIYIADTVFPLRSSLFAGAMTQRDALAWIINNETAQLLDLVTRIVSTHLTPTDRFNLFQASDPGKRNKVDPEGYRTIAGLKILANPSLLDGLPIRPYINKKLTCLASKFTHSRLAPIAFLEEDEHGPSTRRRRGSFTRYSRLVHFTPLRYPGGKGKLAPFIKALLEANSLVGGQYAEPYAGGAAIGVELLLQGYVSRIYINDISRAVHAFWRSIVFDTEGFLRLLRNTPLTLRAWDRQKAIFAHQEQHDWLELGFATFFLNRTNHSGILNAGVIGGRDQRGAWKIDARFNGPELAGRIEAIAAHKKQIRLSRQDAATFLRKNAPAFGANTLLYLDPPYYKKGKDLYYDYYDHADHEQLACLVKSFPAGNRWIVSYDNVPPIQDLYRGCPRLEYGLGYSARDVHFGSEVMYFSGGLKIPPPAGAMRPLDPPPGVPRKAPKHKRRRRGRSSRSPSRGEVTRCAAET